MTDLPVLLSRPGLAVVTSPGVVYSHPDF